MHIVRTCWAALPPRGSGAAPGRGGCRRRRQHAGAAGGDAHEVGGSASRRCQGRHRRRRPPAWRPGRAARYPWRRRWDRAQAAAIRRFLHRSLADVAAQGAVQAGRLAELLASSPRMLRAREVAAGPGDLVPQRPPAWRSAGTGPRCRQRPRGRPAVALLGLAEVAVHAVQQGVGRFVGDDVVGQAGEDHALPGRDARVGGGGGEIAEQQGLLLRVVVGVGSRRAWG